MRYAGAGTIKRIGKVAAFHFPERLATITDIDAPAEVTIPGTGDCSVTGNLLNQYNLDYQGDTTISWGFVSDLNGTEIGAPAGIQLSPDNTDCMIIVDSGAAAGTIYLRAHSSDESINDRKVYKDIAITIIGE